MQITHLAMGHYLTLGLLEKTIPPITEAFVVRVDKIKWLTFVTLGWGLLTQRANPVTAVSSTTAPFAQMSSWAWTSIGRHGQHTQESFASGSGVYSMYLATISAFDTDIGDQHCRALATSPKYQFLDLSCTIENNNASSTPRTTKKGGKVKKKSVKQVDKHKSHAGGLTKAAERSITGDGRQLKAPQLGGSARKKIVLRSNEGRQGPMRKNSKLSSPLESGSANEAVKGKRPKTSPSLTS